MASTQSKGAEAHLQAVRFVASALNVPDCEPSTSTATGQVQINTSDSGTLVGISTVCQYLASKSQQKGLLGTGDAIAAAQIQEWLTWVSTELTPLMDDKLVKVNEHLQSRTYLVGNALTLADLVVYGVVQPAAAAFPVAQTLHFASLLRWADFLQHTVDKKRFFPLFSFDKPRYQFTPAPVAPKAPAPAAPAAPAAKPEAAAAPAKAAVAAGPAPGGKPAAKEQAADKKGDQAAPAAKDKGAKKDAAPAQPAGKKDDDEVSIDMLDIRVGKIVKVDKHPNADALYLEEIDVGEDKPRQVISGLVKFVPREQMQDRVVLVVCNLKPAKMRDVMSYGMVLCASNETHDQVDPVKVPEGVALGERVTVEGFSSAPLEEVNPKKKILERLFPDMKTDASGNAVFKGVPFMTSKGPVTSTIPNGWVK